MTVPPPLPMPPSDDTSSVDPRIAIRDRIGTIVAWIVITICVVGIAVAVQRSATARNVAQRQAEVGQAASQADPQVGLVAKYAVGVTHIMRSLGAPPPPTLASEMRDAVKSRANHLKLVPVLAELNGKEAALAELDRLVPSPVTRPTTAPVTQPATPATRPATQPVILLHPDDARIANILRDLYSNGPEALSNEERQSLVTQLGWTGRLALTFGQPNHPDHQALVSEAIQFAIVLLIVGLSGLSGVLVGLVLLIVLIVLLVQRSITMRYQEPAISPALSAMPGGGFSGLRAGELPPPWAAYSGTIQPVLGSADVNPAAKPYVLPPLPHAGRTAEPGLYRFGSLGVANGRTAPFLEAFAIYLAGQVGFSLLIRHFFDNGHLAWNFVVLVPVIVALFWPRIRGIRGGDFRRGFGWTAPRGVLRELGSGVVGYIAGLPVFAIGIIIVLILISLTKASPTHPVVQEAGAGGTLQTLMLYLLAAVWAPIVEETFFRGALFHHLRTRWGWIMTALLSSLIFAIIHPQGWTLVPGLASLAIVFCAIREWRGSTLGGMMAHALHNGTLVTILVLAAG